jgi:hypothetical protein
MENDTLWIQTAGGRKYFTSRRIDVNTKFNLFVYAYPFDPPLQFFPDSSGLNASIAYAGNPDPDPEQFDLESGNSFRQEGTTIRAGGLNNSIVEYDPAEGVKSLQYSFGIYDREYWTAGGWPYEYPNQYFHEYVFTCSLANDVP